MGFCYEAVELEVLGEESARVFGEVGGGLRRGELGARLLGGGPGGLLRAVYLSSWSLEEG